MAVPTPDPSIAAKALMDYVIRIQDESHTIRGHWAEISQDMQRAAGKASTGFVGALNRFIGLSPVLHGVSDALQGALNPKGSIQEMEIALRQAGENVKTYTDEWRKSLEEKKRVLALGAGASPDEKEEAEFYHKASLEYKNQARAQVSQLSATINLQKVIQSQMSSMAGVLIPAMVKGFREVLKSTWEINKSFQQATTSGWERYRLLRETLGVQRSTGASTEDINKTMSALVSHGFDLDKNLGDVAKTVTMMELGLGVSADKGAELSSAFRNLGQPVRQAADGIARLQRDTALSASSATQYYTQIARAMSLLRPGAGGMAAQVAELVGQFEGASQKVLGRSGDITKLITDMSGLEGMSTAAQLGMQPDFMADPAKVTEALNRLNAQVNERLAGSSGFSRVAILESLSTQYGIQKDVLANLNKIVEERNKQVLSQTTLEEAYNDQMKLLGNSLSQIKNVLMASMREAFAPLVFVFAQLAAGVRWLMDMLVNATVFGIKP